MKVSNLKLENLKLETKLKTFASGLLFASFVEASTSPSGAPNNEVAGPASLQQIAATGEEEVPAAAASAECVEIRCYKVQF